MLNYQANVEVVIENKDIYSGFKEINCLTNIDENDPYIYNIKRQDSLLHDISLEYVKDFKVPTDRSSIRSEFSDYIEDDDYVGINNINILHNKPIKLSSRNAKYTTITNNNQIKEETNNIINNNKKGGEQQQDHHFLTIQNNSSKRLIVHNIEDKNNPGSCSIKMTKINDEKEIKLTKRVKKLLDFV